MEVDSGEKESAVAILLLGCALKLNESKRSKCRRKRRILVKSWLLKIGKKEEFIKKERFPSSPTISQEETLLLCKKKLPQ